MFFVYTYIKAYIHTYTYPVINQYMYIVIIIIIIINNIFFHVIIFPSSHRIIILCSIELPYLLNCDAFNVLVLAFKISSTLFLSSLNRNISVKIEILAFGSVNLGPIKPIILIRVFNDTVILTIFSKLLDVNK